ncbi:helix-turn-helix transcriptional regulator [Christensenellaceae bacterium 44-20]
MFFSERLLELRKSRNLTQKDVYSAVGLSALGYQRYEYGQREPAFQKLIALADFFDVSLDYLVGRSDDPARH